jgi:signal transduction histidine kinase
MMKHRLKTKLSLSIALVVLLTVILISYFSNLLMNKRFTDYKLAQLENSTQQIAGSLALQYDQTAQTWNADFVHSIGMLALSDGFLITVRDVSGNIVWDAETCDRAYCHQLMADMTEQMEARSPGLEGGFVPRTMDINIGTKPVGTLTIVYYSPYFLSENDSSFLNSFNTILVVIGFASLLVSVLVGFFLARRLGDPLLKTVEITRKIATGNFNVRIHEKTSTKEVLELMDQVNLLAESLEKQENLRKQLTADVAHELRTPLTTLQTHIEAMIEGVWEPTSERLKSCQDEIVRINRMVVDLENLSKIEKGNLDLQMTAVRLKESVQKAVSGYQTVLEKKNLRVSIEGDCAEIMADTGRIDQVVANLLSNAVKYTPDGGAVTVFLSDTDHAVRLCIRDTGIGISENDLPFVFERFYRADKSRCKMTGGSGIGLAIVKSIVLAHGGTVSVLSKLGEGSEFVVEFPK